MACRHNTSIRSYVRPASESLQRAAECASCDEDGVVVRLLLVYAGLSFALLVVVIAFHRIHRAMPALARYWHACKPLVKLKVCVLLRIKEMIDGPCSPSLCPRAMTVERTIVDVCQRLCHRHPNRGDVRYRALSPTPSLSLEELPPGC